MLFALVLMSLNGCGWRLRGAVDVEMAAPPAMQVRFQQASADLKRELNQKLASAGVDLNDSADLVLMIHSEKQGRRVLSVGSSGKVSEYDLQYELLFSLRNGGQQLISNERISQQRDYQFDDASVLAKGEEEKRLFEFMRRMAVQKLLRRLQSAVVNQAETANAN
ncbi:MAG TPA: hypothetical protein ENK35_01140 [Candidatus Tenderia sp.]|nr:hypothetical protein [Candidatus Tenderia sp.]